MFNFVFPRDFFGKQEIENPIIKCILLNPKMTTHMLLFCPFSFFLSVKTSTTKMVLGR